MREVKVTYENGEEMYTAMAKNVTDEEIRNYFKIGTPFNIGYGEHDRMEIVKKVEILK